MTTKLIYVDVTEDMHRDALDQLGALFEAAEVGRAGQRARPEAVSREAALEHGGQRRCQPSLPDHAEIIGGDVARRAGLDVDRRAVGELELMHTLLDIARVLKRGRMRVMPPRCGSATSSCSRISAAVTGSASSRTVSMATPPSAIVILMSQASKPASERP
jgi:hypothetical protein